MDRLPLVVWSHLRWQSVFQRPHHLITRLSRHRKVIFVEEPVPILEDRDSCELKSPIESVLVVTPRLRSGATTFGPASERALIPMMRDLLSGLGITHHAAWLYTPMACRAARALGAQVVAYDCMDELSAFWGAAPELRQRERELLSFADVVFAGGRSLFHAKRGTHPHAFYFPSSVDANHFGHARDPAIAHPDETSLGTPRLGFFGVIDERLDRDVVSVLATAHPDWQVVLVGPVVKIDPASLPRAANLHYLGQRSYAELPEHLAGWDVCLLPFARNDATRFISPTKTLEYMAAEKPIVTTPIRDVVEPYETLVYVAGTPDGFAEACEHALRESDTSRAQRVAGMRAVVQQTSWDTTAAAMESELERAVWRHRRPHTWRARAASHRGMR